MLPARSRRRVARPRPDDGFSFIELVVGLAIMVMIATVVAPVLVGAIDGARVEQGKQALQGMATAIGEFHSQVTTSEHRHPSHLGQLVEPVTTTQPSACGESFTSTDVNRWTGPYLSRVVPPSGMPVGIGVVRPQLITEPVSPKSALLKIVVDGVTSEDALALDREVDGDGSDAEGAIRWGAPSPEGLVVLEYALPIGCGKAANDDGGGEQEGEGHGCWPPAHCRNGKQ